MRSGATVIVTLDTDAGTLRLGLWKDSISSSSLSGVPLVQNVVSPSKKSGLSSGVVEDWGIAFEGLPLDSRLYPAIGLYQRDDRVTVLSVVESSGRASPEAILTAGTCFYPHMSREKEDVVHQVRLHNDLVSWEGTQYAVEMLNSLDTDKMTPGPLLPSLAASLCLVPSSVPVLSTRLALVLLPQFWFSAPTS